MRRGGGYRHFIKAKLYSVISRSLLLFGRAKGAVTGEEGKQSISGEDP